MNYTRGFKVILMELSCWSYCHTYYMQKHLQSSHEHTLWPLRKLKKPLTNSCLRAHIAHFQLKPAHDAHSVILLVYPSGLPPAMSTIMINMKPRQSCIK